MVKLESYDNRKTVLLSKLISISCWWILFFPWNLVKQQYWPVTNLRACKPLKRNPPNYWKNAGYFIFISFWKLTSRKEVKVCIKKKLISEIYTSLAKIPFIKSPSDSSNHWENPWKYSRDFDWKCYPTFKCWFAEITKSSIFSNISVISLY